MGSCEKGFKMNGKDCENSFERLMNQNGNSDRLREAFIQELLKSEWKEQVRVLIFQYIEGRDLRRIKVEDIIQNVAPKAAALVPEECRNAILNNVSKIVKA